jgi:hypothetical protein
MTFTSWSPMPPLSSTSAAIFAVASTAGLSRPAIAAVSRRSRAWWNVATSWLRCACPAGVGVGDATSEQRGSSALTGGFDAGLALDRDPETPDGQVFFLRRNGAAGKMPVLLDFDSRTFSATDAMDTPPAKPSLKEAGPGRRVVAGSALFRKSRQPPLGKSRQVAADG